ncbi:MAG TPA: glutathione S-transferase family protein [Rhizomicrobium sp.]|nr:glutathione S-transferase family protein [Rhizomicrobium sp.]
MKYTLIVGTKDWSSWSLRPYLALRHVGVKFDEIVVPLRATATSPEILKHSPAGRVPVLKIGERAIWDSLAICETLNDLHPEAGLWPDDPLTRAEARAAAAEMHSGFADVRDQLSMDFVRRLPLPELREATKAQIARILEAWEAALARHGGPYLFGRFSIADCMYAPVVSRFTTYGIQAPARTKAYMETVWALPAMEDWRKAAQQEVDSGGA